MINKILRKFRRSNNTITSSETNAPVKTTSEEEEHHEWDRPIEFVFSLISNSVGLGNVWRFPYLAARSGGGAFLIPYFVLYFLIGAPLYYLELALGQFSSRGPATAFILAKGWQGVGFAMIINSVLCMLYYNVVISWALFYFISSFRKRLLWSDCGHWWNTVRCFVPGDRGTTYTINGTTFNCTKLQYQNPIQHQCTVINLTDRITATEEFYYNLLLQKSKSFDDFGTPTLYMALSLLVSWVIVCLCIIKGVKTSGKVAYFTAIFPYVVLLILIIYTSTLSGAVDGVKFYIIPKWELVGDFKTWQAAASQVFFSLGLSFGSLMAYSASNKFDNNFFKQMCIVVSCDCLTGVFAGFAVFATIGFLAKALNETVEKYAASSGPGLAFITYPEAISNMPASPFFAIIFFLMLLALGLGSQFALTDVPITSLVELFPRLKKKRPIAVVITCVISYLISITFTCPGGIYFFELLQEYSANTSMLVVGFFEVIVISYIYGFNRFMNDVEMMLRKRAAEYYLFLTWYISAPLLIIIITITKLISAEPIKLGAGGGFPEYIFPRWSTILGWFIFVFCIIPIPLVFLVNYIKECLSLRAAKRNPKSPIQNNVPKPIYLHALTENNSPSEDWGPKRKENQIGLYQRKKEPFDNHGIPLEILTGDSDRRKELSNNEQY
ncbi:unnamed protein product [Rotaria socialis]|uniref:Transporter n=1 Tax=Rotaria socialis TaxID=392032 RepID=A0A818SZT6_9BILA|nr:unnamed protein product [Rotaria socialis]CAF3432600.1 unnamed protein product [Rotaria socialis]CAF3551381.1 unnamed protein product [Rotaria socialis]CAF3677937.1 unnamed protein product [Rotaria socialis]